MRKTRKVTVSYVDRFYNTNLLERIISGHTDSALTDESSVAKAKCGDIWKLEGTERSCIVEVLEIGPADCNKFHMVRFKVLCEIPGELQIKYIIPVDTVV